MRIKGYYSHGVIAIALCALFLSAGILAKPAVSSADKIVLKAVTAWPKPVTDNQAFFIFADLVKQKVEESYPGQLEIKYLGGPEAVKTMEQVHALQTGLIDMAFTATAYYTSIIPEVDAVKLSDFPAWQERQRGAWAFLNSLHQKKGIYYLGRLGLDIKFHLYLTKPIKTADLKGLNIRVSPMYLQGIKALGGNPVVIRPPEVYTALQRGLVDGYCWPAMGIRDWGWEKLTKYVVEPGFYRVPNPVLVGLKTWRKLPEKFKDLLTEAAIEAEKKAAKHFAEIVKKDRPMILKAGIKVIELPPAEKEKFLRGFYEPAWADILKKSPEAGAKLKRLLTK